MVTRRVDLDPPFDVDPAVATAAAGARFEMLLAAESAYASGSGVMLTLAVMLNVIGSVHKVLSEDVQVSGSVGAADTTDTADREAADGGVRPTP